MFDLTNKVDSKFNISTNLEFVGTVGGTDGDSQGVNFSGLNKVTGLFRISELDGTRDVFFDTTEGTKFSFNRNTVSMGVFSDFLSDSYVFIVWVMGSINHDRAEA